MKRCQSGWSVCSLLLRNPLTGLPEELLRKAEEELAHVAAVGSKEESVMADDKLNRGEPDRSRINMSEDYEVKYWMERLGTTREELQKVVDRAGIPRTQWRRSSARSPSTSLADLHATVV